MPEMARLPRDEAQKRTAAIPHVLKMARHGHSSLEIERATGVPARSARRYIDSADIAIAAPPDMREELANIALQVAIECLESARENLPEASAHDAARSARIAADIYLDLTEGRRGTRVAIDARSVSIGGPLAEIDTARLMMLADALGEPGIGPAAADADAD